MSQQTERRYNFLDSSKKYSIISSIVVFAIIVLTLVFGARYDSVMKKGAVAEYSYTGSVSTTELEKNIKSATGADVSVQLGTETETKESIFTVTLSGKELSDTLLSDATGSLQSSFSENDITPLAQVQSDTALGKGFALKAVMAFVVGAVIVLLYFAVRYRKLAGWTAGATAILALLHNTVIVYGVYLVLRLPVGGEFIAALLTTISFTLHSIFATYDRIEEDNKVLGLRLPIRQVALKSMNQSIPRALSVMLFAAGVLLIMMIVGFIFSISSFVVYSIPALIGLLAACYATAFIASPIWVKVNAKQAKRA